MASISVAQASADQAAEAISRAFALGSRMEQMFTRFSTTSPLGLANSNGSLRDVPPQLTALLGAVIVAGFYLVVGGRVFCSWVCPVNLVTDCAGWSRRRLGLKGGRMPPRSLRRWLLAAVLLASAFSGSMVWELVNPVSLLHREILFGAGIGLVLVLAVFIYDLVIAQRGWCGHVCPMGAAYGLIGRASLLRVSAPARARCDDCMDCFAVCPEPQVIKPALKGDAQSSPVILNGDCTNCGRCIDVCAQDVFRFSHRFDKRSEES